MGGIDLSVEKPTLVKPFVDYLYHAEYEPFMLPDPEKKHWQSDEEMWKVYHYDFPHSCGKDCPKPNVCPHHNCRYIKCAAGSCKNFVCRDCTEAITPSDPSKAFAADQLAMHVDMFMLGCKYDVDGLPELATEKFQQAARRFFHTTEFEEVVQAIVEKDEDGVEELRKVIVETIAAHGELYGKGKIKRMLESKAGFAFEVLRASDAGRRGSDIL